MNKSAEAFRTIGEVAEDLDVPKHVLRFWEGKFPQIRPMKRGGGRRYYRPEDMDLLRGIRHLLHAEGYTIKGVQKILREHGIDQVKGASHAALSAAKDDAGKKKRGRKREAAGDKSATAIADLKKATSSSSARDVIALAIRELEGVRATLLGHPVAEAEQPGKRQRAARS
ncbi:MAG: MerR family transcriptional regulator [Hyphomicrobium sp.]